MKKLILLSFTLFTLSCQAFNRPLFEEENKKLLWYRCLQIETCLYDLKNLKESCDEKGWNDENSQNMIFIINSLESSLNYSD